MQVPFVGYLFSISLILIFFLTGFVGIAQGQTPLKVLSANERYRAAVNGV